jgi:hypothetical protein
MLLVARMILLFSLRVCFIDSHCFEHFCNYSEIYTLFPTVDCQTLYDCFSDSLPSDTVQSQSESYRHLIRWLIVEVGRRLSFVCVAMVEANRLLSLFLIFQFCAATNIFLPYRIV